MTRKSSFGAIADDRTRIVIFGSLPGEKSLEAHQYYAHPSNQFWRLIGGVIGKDLSLLKYDDRISVMLNAHVGLWDVIASARRSGSLDSNIRDAEPNRLIDLRDRMHNLCAIGFNGAKATKVGCRQLPANPGFAAIDLPSSSAGYCAVSLAWKQERWDALKAYL